MGNQEVNKFRNTIPEQKVSQKMTPAPMIGVGGVPQPIMAKSAPRFSQDLIMAMDQN